MIETLPDWYEDTRSECAAKERSKTRGAGLYVRRAVASIGEALARELSGGPPPESWLSRLEPRAKVAGFVALVFGASLLHEPVVLAGLLGCVTVLMLTSGIAVRRLGRIWLGVPLFNLLIMLPAVTNLVTHGQPLLTLWHIGPGARLGPWPLPDAITVTRPGMAVAGRFLLRSVDCVMLCFLLIATTDSRALMAGLRRLGVPRSFGMVLAMTQRYLSVLLRAAEEVHLSKLSRSIGVGSARREQRWVAAGIGNLFRRAHRLAQEVHNAMLSRGYDGEVRLPLGSRLCITDGVWLIGSIAFVMALIAADRLI